MAAALLPDPLQMGAVAAYGKRSTDDKFLINPSLSTAATSLHEAGVYPKIMLDGAKGAGVRRPALRHGGRPDHDIPTVQELVD